MTRLVTLLGSMKENAEVLKILFSIIAGIYVAWQYYLNVEDAKIKRTLEYSKRYEQGKVFEARRAVDMFWLKEGSVNFLKEFRENQTWDELIDVTNKAIDAGDIKKESIYVIQAFYKDLTVCVYSKLCSYSTACDLFASNIRNFTILYFDFLDDWQETFRTDVYDSLINFHQSCGSKRHNEICPNMV